MFESFLKQYAPDWDVKKTSKRSFHPIGFDSNFFRSSTLEFPSRTPTLDRARVPLSNTSTPDPEPDPRPSPRNTPTRPSVRLPSPESPAPHDPIHPIDRRYLYGLFNTYNFFPSQSKLDGIRRVETRGRSTFDLWGRLN
ncbi:hypothetical protein SAY87_001902 [Trapa incisa]|uniref:Uncharacterized protein n=1 Tax=Trapa incisa TaxID=236973 RepID=A0AAN7PU96_9MYRT|nr:hypothetical protein SAY87_001902 [Trapa incisa]